MRKQKVHSTVSMETLAGGAFAEKFNEALADVAANIQNPNTEATAKRGITINIKFSPNKTRSVVNAQISVSTKLASTESIDTELVMGADLRTGTLEIAEVEQLTFADLQRPVDEKPRQQSEEEPPEPVQAEAPAQEPQPTGKPLDLRKRTKKAEAEVLGYDPETGEVYDDNVVNINKAAEA